MQVEQLQEYVDDICKDIAYYEDGSKTVAFRTSAYTFDELKKEAKQKGISVSKLINIILQCYTGTSPHYN